MMLDTMLLLMQELSYFGAQQQHMRQTNSSGPIKIPQVPFNCRRKRGTEW